MAIHPAALVDPTAEIAAHVEIGPFAVVGAGVRIGTGVSVGHHASVLGPCEIGAGCQIFPFASIGSAPQDLTYRGEPTRLEIGCDNVIREHVSIHRGTVEGGGCTRIGDANWIMNASHIGHDCVVGSSIVMASFGGLAGHVVVEDHAVLGAYTGVHQHARIGESAMTASGSRVSLDAPPFGLVAGDRARLVGLNTIGLERRGFEAPTVAAIKHAHHLVFHSRLRLEEAVARIGAEIAGVPEVDRFVGFLRDSERGFCRSARSAAPSGRV